MIQTSTLWTIEGPDGTTLTLGDDPIYLEEVTGFADSPTIRTNIEELPEDDGAVAGDSFYGARPVTLRGLITGATAAERNQNMLNLKRVFRALRGDVILKSQPDGLPAMQATARLEQLRIAGPYVKTFHVGLICPDPLYYSQELHGRSAPTNKVATNADFETGDLTGWTSGLGGAGTIAVASDVAAARGIHFVRGTAGGGSDSARVTTQLNPKIDVDITKPYVLTAYYQKEAGSVTPRSTIRLWCYDAADVFLGLVMPNEAVDGVNHAPGFFDPGAGWSRWGGRYRGQAGVSGTGTGGFIAGTKKVRVEAYLSFSPTGAVTVLLDAVQLEQGEEASDFNTGAFVTGARFPWAFPVSFGGGSGAFAETTVANDGIADVAPQVRVWGPVTDPILENAGTGEKLYLDALALAAGDYVDVDFAARTVKRADGSSAYDRVRFPDSVWWKLRPGATSVQLRGLTSSAGVTIDVSWRDAWD